jgi:hypothetical protein
MPDRALVHRPAIMGPVADIEAFVHDGALLSQRGEIITPAEAENVDLVAGVIMAQELRRIAGEMMRIAETELAQRVRTLAGPIDTEYGTARESVSRGSISGTTAQRIRDVLEKHAADGTIPWEAVDNVAPMQAHVTPAKISQYAEDAPASIAADLEDLLPEKRRSLKVDARLV